MNPPSPTRTATSSDGTVIAFDTAGGATPDAPLVVLVGGATNRRADCAGLLQALAAQGCVAVVHDRRGRGDSGDTAPYAVQREVEDVAAVVEAAQPGGSAVLVGFSSGAALALQAAAALAGDPTVAGVVAFEPPYRLPDSPPLPSGYTTELERLNAAGDAAGALEFFQLKAVGMPQEAADGFKGTPFWTGLLTVAHTLAYDGHCLGGDDHSVPTELLGRIDVPVLGLASTGSPPFLRAPVRQVVAALAHGTSEEVEGGFHTAPDEVLAARVARFARSL